MVACHRKGEALFPRYSRGNGTFDQPSAVTWRFFIDIAMEYGRTETRNGPNFDNITLFVKMICTKITGMGIEKGRTKTLRHVS